MCLCYMFAKLKKSKKKRKKKKEKQSCSTNVRKSDKLGNLIIYFKNKNDFFLFTALK